MWDVFSKGSPLGHVPCVTTAEVKQTKQLMPTTCQLIIYGQEPAELLLHITDSDQHKPRNPHPHPYCQL